jgi:hypothetical protein
LFLFIGGTICYASCLAAVGGGGLIVGASVLYVLGFAANGIIAEPWAAAFMAYYAGHDQAGGIFKFLQSRGVCGASWASCGSVFKMCTALCTVSDYSDSREEDSQYPIIVSK